MMNSPRRVLLAAAAALALAHLAGVVLDAPSPWRWAGVGACVALAGYAALATAEARPGARWAVVRWALAAGPLVLAGWLATRPAALGAEGLQASRAEGEPTLTLELWWFGLLRTGPLLIAVGGVGLALALVAAARRSDQERGEQDRGGGEGRPRLWPAVAVAVVGGAAVLGHAYLTVREHAELWSFGDRRPPVWPLAAAVSGEVVLALLALAGVGAALAVGGRSAAYPVVGLALLAAFALAGLPHVLDQTVLDLSSAYLRPGNTSAAQLFVYVEAPPPLPLGAMLRTAALLAGTGLAVFGAARATRRWQPSPMMDR